MQQARIILQRFAAAGQVLAVDPAAHHHLRQHLGPKTVCQRSPIPCNKLAPSYRLVKSTGGGEGGPPDQERPRVNARLRRAGIRISVAGRVQQFRAHKRRNVTKDHLAQVGGTVVDGSNDASGLGGGRWFGYGSLCSRCGIGT